MLLVSKTVVQYSSLAHSKKKKKRERERELLKPWYVLMKQVILSFSECVPSEVQKTDDQYKSPRSKTGVISKVFKILGVRPSRALPALITTRNWALVLLLLCYCCAIAVLSPWCFFFFLSFFGLFICGYFNRSICLKKDEERKKRGF